MPRKETANTIKPHTEAKLQLYIKYLERYLAILLRAKGISQVNIYDMFCGEGLYSDGNSGSAVRAVDAVWAAVQSCQNNVLVNLLLNDLDGRKISKVEAILSGRQSIKHGIEIKYSSKEASLLIGQLAKGFQTQPISTKNIVFIDPYGYKTISYSALRALLENDRTEIILFLPVEQMFRFLSKVEEEVTDKSYIPLKKFVDQFGLDAKEINSEKEMIQAVKKSLTFGGSYRSTCYSIRNHSGHYYGMFFVTNNLYGLEKIQEVKWKLDEQQGEGFNGNISQDMFFEIEMMDYLKCQIMDELRGSGISNCDLYEFALEEGFLPKHVNPILREMQNNNQIIVVDKKNGAPVRKGAFKVNYNNWRDRGDEYLISLDLEGKA